MSLDLKKAGLDKTKLPKHIAIIMDGNGRWAQKRGLPRYLGHQQGMRVLGKRWKPCWPGKFPALRFLLSAPKIGIDLRMKSIIS